MFASERDQWSILIENDPAGKRKRIPEDASPGFDPVACEKCPCSHKATDLQSESFTDGSLSPEAKDEPSTDRR
jgi:hypothetical protein